MKLRMKIQELYSIDQHEIEYYLETHFGILDKPAGYGSRLFDYSFPDKL
jgi:hypothetical protein